MKKTLLYSFLPCLMAMLMCTTFTACGDDDDENNNGTIENNGGTIDNNAIVGRWLTYEGEDADPEWEERTIAEFKKDGTLITEYYIKQKNATDFTLDETEVGRYTLGDGKLIIQETTEDERKLVYSINFTSNNTFSMTLIGVYDENGKYYDISSLPENIENTYTFTVKRI